MAGTETESVEVIISDDSKIADGQTQKLRNAVKRSVEAILALPEYMTKTAELFKTVAHNRALARSFVILADGEPDWTGGSQTYKLEVNSAEASAFESYSDQQKRSFDSNVRSHMRRGVLDKVILAWVRENRAGMKDLPEDSPALKKEMRRQYARTESQPNPIAVPQQWLDSEPSGTGNGEAGQPKDTPVSKVNAAAVALTELSGVERIAHVHAMLTSAVMPLIQPNAEVPGGRKRAGDALLDLAKLATAAANILGNANLTGDALTEAIATAEKYAYTG